MIKTHPAMMRMKVNQQRPQSHVQLKKGFKFAKNAVYFAYILIRVMCLVVLPLMQCEDKLAAGDQAQCGGRKGEDVIPEDQSDGEFFYFHRVVIFTYSVKHEN